MKTSTFFYVEARFAGEENFKRNFVGHRTYAEAEAMERHFTRIAETRIVKVTETEEVVTGDQPTLRTLFAHKLPQVPAGATHCIVDVTVTYTSGDPGEEDCVILVGDAIPDQDCQEIA